MNNKIKELAHVFLKEYKLREVTLTDIKKIIQSQGYAVVEFNSIYNDENVALLIEVLGLDEQIKQSKGFTYVDSKRRLVFLNEDLSETEKLFVLAHEEGHIYCNHLSSQTIVGRDVMEEHEANEFTHYILKNSLRRKNWIHSNKTNKSLCITAIILVVLIWGTIVFNFIKQEQSYYGKYYLTSTGNKYHKEECIFVKEKKNIHRITKKEYGSGKYEPCGICLPLDSEESKPNER